MNYILILTCSKMKLRVHYRRLHQNQQRPAIDSDIIVSMIDVKLCIELFLEGDAVPLAVQDLFTDLEASKNRQSPSDSESAFFFRISCDDLSQVYPTLYNQGGVGIRMPDQRLVGRSGRQ